jgi:Holliday junction resolvase RusA-like endonuclease
VAVQRLEIPALPPSLNCLMRGKLRRRMRLGQLWRKYVWAFSLRGGLAPADGRRRVSFTVTYPPGRRRHDVDAFQKAILDGLTYAGLIVDDGPRWVELGPVRYARGEYESVEIVLEDLP